MKINLFFFNFDCFGILLCRHVDSVQRIRVSETPEDVPIQQVLFHKLGFWQFIEHSFIPLLSFIQSELRILMAQTV
jgi:hypothetical protein